MPTAHEAWAIVRKWGDDEPRHGVVDDAGDGVVVASRGDDKVATATRGRVDAAPVPSGAAPPVARVDLTRTFVDEMARTTSSERKARPKASRQKSEAPYPKRGCGEIVSAARNGGTSDSSPPPQKATGHISLSSNNQPNNRKQLLNDWDTHYQELIDYKAKHGDCNPKTTEPGLGRWVACQRRLYSRKKRGETTPSLTLTAEREQKLDAIGFAWRITKRTQTWDDRFEDLVLFKERHGHFNVSTTQDKDLACWTMYLRNEYRKKKRGEKSHLSNNRELRLRQIGFNLDRERRKQREVSSNKRRKVYGWNPRYQQLIDYKAANGHCDVPVAEKSGLGNWVRKLRQDYRLKKQGTTAGISLTDEQEEKLNAIDFAWQIQRKQRPWQDYFEDLLEFKAKHDHCNVRTVGEYGNVDLAKWVHNQRSYYRKKKMGEQSSLSDEREKKLCDMGFEWDETKVIRKRRTWEMHFADLLQYNERNGHCQVPITDETGRLGTWVSEQRWSQHTGKLSLKKKKALDDIGFVWDV